MCTDFSTRRETVSQTLQDKRQFTIKAAKVIQGGGRRLHKQSWVILKHWCACRREHSQYCLPLSKFSEAWQFYNLGGISRETAWDLTAECTLNLQTGLWRGRVRVFIWCVVSVRSQPKANPLQCLFTRPDVSAAQLCLSTDKYLAGKDYTQFRCYSISVNKVWHKGPLKPLPRRKAESQRPGEACCFSSCSRGNWTYGLAHAVLELSHYDWAPPHILWVA